MSQLDDQLEEMRRVHRATARYTVYLRPANFAKGREIIGNGLTWDEANTRCDALNLTLAPRRFGDKLYGIELEKGSVCTD